MPARALLFAGDLYIDRVDPATGLATGLVGPWEAEKFAIKTNAVIKERKSRGKTTYGQVVATVALGDSGELEITLSETTAAGLAMALQGTTSALTQSGGTITAESITARLGIWVPLSKRKFQAAGFIVTHTSGTPTYVLGTDYEVNHDQGWVRTKTGGAIVDGATIKVTGTYQAITGTTISGGTQAQVRAKFVLDGKNVADDQLVTVTVYEGVVSSGDVLDLLSGEFAQVPLKGKMTTPSGYTSPFKVDLHGITQ